jgi:hypothetical protein
MRNSSGKSCRDNQNTRFKINNMFFLRKSCRSWDKVGNCRAGLATDEQMAHAHCMLDTYGYEYTLRMCNTYWFSTAAMVTRMRLSVTLHVHCLYCFESDATSSDICVPQLHGKIMPPILGWKGLQHKYEVTRRYMPEDSKLYSLRRESTKSHALTVLHLPCLTSSDSISFVSTQFDSYGSSPADIRKTVRSFSQAICCAT